MYNPVYHLSYSGTTFKYVSLLFVMHHLRQATLIVRLDIDV